MQTKLIILLIVLSFNMHAAHKDSVKQATKVHAGRKKSVSDYPAVMRLNNHKVLPNVGSSIAINQCLITSAHLIKDNYNVDILVSNEDASFRTRIDDLKVLKPFPGDGYPDGVRTDDIAVAKLDDKPKDSFNESVLDGEFCKEYQEKLKANSIKGLVAGYGATSFKVGGGYVLYKRSEIAGTNAGSLNESESDRKLREYKENIRGELHDGDLQISEGDNSSLILSPDPQLPLAGDSGGPIFVLDKNKNKKLVGVVSAVYSDRMKGVAANLCKHITWIKEQLKKYGCIK